MMLKSKRLKPRERTCPKCGKIIIGASPSRLGNGGLCLKCYIEASQTERGMMPKASQEAYLNLVAQLGRKAALFPELVEALRDIEEHVRLLRGIYRYTQGDDAISQQLAAKAQAILVKAAAIEKEAKG